MKIHNNVKNWGEKNTDQEQHEVDEMSVFIIMSSLQTLCLSQRNYMKSENNKVMIFTTVTNL